jgi:hypothetical protein
MEEMNATGSRCQKRSQPPKLGRGEKEAEEGPGTWSMS